MCLIKLPANYGAVEHLESLKNLSFYLFWRGVGGGGGRGKEWAHSRQFEKVEDVRPCKLDEARAKSPTPQFYLISSVEWKLGPLT